MGVLGEDRAEGLIVDSRDVRSNPSIMGLSNRCHSRLKFKKNIPLGHLHELKRVLTFMLARARRRAWCTFVCCSVVPDKRQRTWRIAHGMFLFM